MQDQETVLRLARLLYDRKAQDIAVLNVTHLTVLCDTMVIASGRSNTQVSALADAVDELMAQEGLDLRRSEAAVKAAGSSWITARSSSISSTGTNVPSMALTASGMMAPTPSLSPSTRPSPIKTISHMTEGHMRY